MPLVAGIDGCRAGWLCVSRDLSSGSFDARILRRVDELLDLRPDVALNDIPIGLTETGPRLCDLEARRMLGPRRNSVFPAPIRPLLAASCYPDACRIGRDIHGKAISKQSWAIVPRICEVDAFLQAYVGRQVWLREVHPEVSFRAWNGGAPMPHPKRSPEGEWDRQNLVVARYGPAFFAARKSLPSSSYAMDDLLDAFAALWSAERAYHGRATVTPVVQPIDATGLAMEMVA